MCASSSFIKVIKVGVKKFEFSLVEEDAIACISIDVFGFSVASAAVALRAVTMDSFTFTSASAFPATPQSDDNDGASPLNTPKIVSPIKVKSSVLARL